MPAAVPSRSGGPSSGRPPATNAPRTHPTRMPAATSSLRVQLPPGEFLDSFGSFGSNAEPRNRSQALVPAAAAQASDDTPAAVAARDARPPNVPPPPQVSDATLLAQGILEQQRKAREILAWQQRLMEDRRISREELKRGLTRLSTPYWLQILQERAIYQLCGYPCCTSRLSSAGGSSSATPRFRISVSRRTIERDTSDDPGGRNNFCSQTCYARSEWVRRWVLDPFSRSGSSTGSAGAGVGAGAGRPVTRGNRLEDPIAAQMRQLGGEQALQGGKWEALTNLREDQWAEIELLEDMEEQGDLDAWEGFGASGQAGASSDAEGSGASAQSRAPTQMHIRNGMGTVMPVSEIVTERKRPPPQAPPAKRQTLARPSASASSTTPSTASRTPTSPTQAKQRPTRPTAPITSNTQPTPPAGSGGAGADSGDAESSLPSRLGSLTISERPTSTRAIAPDAAGPFETAIASANSSPATAAIATAVPAGRTPPRRVRMAPSAFKTGGADALGLDDGNDDGDDDGEGFSGLGSTASLSRQIRDASGRMTRAAGGEMDVEGADQEGVEEEGEEEDEETRKARAEERRLLDEGMNLLEEMRGRGEME